MKRAFVLLCALMATLGLVAQDFDTFFSDRTLRTDLIFSGDINEQDITLRALHSWEGWSGRKHNLSEVPLRGDGELSLIDNASGQTIYRTTFSSLFQEWLAMDEAKISHRAYEFTLLTPMPKEAATLRVVLYNPKQEVAAEMCIALNPNDILIKNLDARHKTPYTTIFCGSAEEKIDVAIVAEGYTAEEMDLFRKDAEATVEALFSHEPFGAMRERFRFIAVESTSDESGVSIPREGVWKESAVGSHFDTFYADRYLTTSAIFQMADLLAGIPYEHIIVLANTDTYGGGGIYNSYTLTTAHHPLFAPVVVHEFGHSFAGLADEYFYDTPDIASNPLVNTIEPWQQNITNLANFESKWADMMPEGATIPSAPTKSAEENYTVGAYEGANYMTKGAYRPAVVCRMRNNTATQFCPVCQRAIKRIIEFYIGE
jgi:hypothetical protein